MSDPPPSDPFPPRPQSRSATTTLLSEPSSSLPVSSTTAETINVSSPSSYAPSDLTPSPNLESQNHQLPAIPSSPPPPPSSAVSPDPLNTNYGRSLLVEANSPSSLVGEYSTNPPPHQSNSSSSAASTSYQSLFPPTASSSSLNGGTPQSSGGGGIGIGISNSNNISTTTRTNSSSSSSYAYPQQQQSQYVEDSTVPTVPVEFDEGVLRALCDLDCGLPLLLDRLKQSTTSCRETSNFLKKRAQIEEEYSKNLSKLVKSSIESYGLSDGKSGSFVNSYLSLLKTHDLLSDNRLKFSQQLMEMSEELSSLSRETEKLRKSSKEVGTRLERHLNEQEGLVEKSRIRFDSAAEELERLLLIKSGESLTTTSIPHASSPPPNSSSNSSSSSSATHGGKGRSLMSKLKGPKNPQQILKQEEELRTRMGQASDSYRASLQGCQVVKQEYFNQQLPKLLKSLKESLDEIDLGNQYHLTRYGFLFESLLVTDGLTISPVSVEDGPGLKAVIEAIDVREDFKTFMQQYSLNWSISGQKGPKRDTGDLSRPQISPRSSTSQLYQHHSSTTTDHQLPLQQLSQPTFGIDLGDQMLRDQVEVPRVLEKCCQAIELHGLDSMGIYRLSGTTSRVQRLKQSLDRDVEGTDLLSEENLTDINDIAAVLKLWFRELPEPLLTWELYHQFIEVAKIENDRLRHIRLHERVNELPDPNYATLKYLMGHLDKVAERESINQMSVSNLSIVFGPNLLSPPPPHLAPHFPPPPPPPNPTSSGSSQSTPSGDSTNTNGGGTGGGSLADTQYKCKCVETILSHYKEIFVE
ncbi:hypothetical protein JCM5350_002160 [Sporobolomyces pararoseus]